MVTVPLPEKQARADEIVAAYDQWRAARKNGGMPDWNALTYARWDKATEPVDKLIKLRALTPAGLAAKIEGLKFFLGPSLDLDDDEAESADMTTSPESLLCLSIVRNLAAMLDNTA